jgi:hypothetical protein
LRVKVDEGSSQRPAPTEGRQLRLAVAKDFGLHTPQDSSFFGRAPIDPAREFDAPHYDAVTPEVAFLGKQEFIAVVDFLEADFPGGNVHRRL